MKKGAFFDTLLAVLSGHLPAAAAVVATKYLYLQFFLHFENPTAVMNPRYYSLGQCLLARARGPKNRIARRTGAPCVDPL